MGRHSGQGRHVPQRRTIATVEMVDTTGTAHLVTVAAAENGVRRGRYTTICGGDVMPAALVAREAHYCLWCAPIPMQRSRGLRR